MFFLLPLTASFAHASSPCGHSPAPPGCMFFLSDDEKFLIKTMRKSEIKTLIAMLPQVGPAEVWLNRPLTCRAGLDTAWQS